jgi:hypothetical protein
LSITKKEKTAKSASDQQQITDSRKKKKKAKTKRFKQRERVRRGGARETQQTPPETRVSQNTKGF